MVINTFKYYKSLKSFKAEFNLLNISLLFQNSLAIERIVFLLIRWFLYAYSVVTLPIYCCLQKPWLERAKDNQPRVSHRESITVNCGHQLHSKTVPHLLHKDTMYESFIIKDNNYNQGCPHCSFRPRNSLPTTWKNQQDPRDNHWGKSGHDGETL